MYLNNLTWKTHSPARCSWRPKIVTYEYMIYVYVEVSMECECLEIIVWRIWVEWMEWGVLLLPFLCHGK